ncbi:FtsK/SpoIIIE domain-containing protein [Nonomuraea sp. NPDC052116]|uniref:FtsK/SpoIIIE domain-containing protein n=1 Tax=Nonomuraea sp. NPDC052116 TaxID=3155665 RepID=UPI00343A156B
MPGDEPHRIVSTTPDTAVVFKPAVVQTPAIITLVIFTVRFVAGLFRLAWRHPVALVTIAVPAGLRLVYGWHVVLLVVVSALVAMGAWAILDRPTFARWVGWRLVAFARWFWIYRRHWQPVMTVAGLARHIRGREYVPRLVKVTSDSWADRLYVRMLDGQAVKDWSDRIENLSHGFGSETWRVSAVKAGQLMLTFPRHDPLVTPIAALPVPDSPTVGPVEIGRQEDGSPWLLRLHGTHVLVAGATGAGKGSIIWSAIRGLIPAVHAGLVEVWALDPKLMELSYGMTAAEDDGIISRNPCRIRGATSTPKNDRSSPWGRSSSWRTKWGADPWAASEDSREAKHVESDSKGMVRCGPTRRSSRREQKPSGRCGG